MLGFYAVVIIKLIIGFFIMLIYLNISGKKRLAEMSPINFIGNFIIGGTIGGAIYSDVTLFTYIMVFIIVISMLLSIEFLIKRIAFFKEATIGHPIPIIKDGKILVDIVKDVKHKINMLNVARQLRLKGIHNFDEIFYAQIETNGEITVIKSKDETPTWLLILNGQIMTYELEEIGKEKEWLFEAMKQCNIPDIKDVFLAKYYNHKITFILQDGTKIKCE